MSTIYSTKEYSKIKEFYKDRTANRSKIPLINHINEGIIILDHINASLNAKRAFCIHPIIQSDEDLKNNYNNILDLDNIIIILAMEYRNIANQYLSKRVISDISEINLSPLKDVNDMLIADKVQNYKDFIIYHKSTHERSKELDLYFNNWLRKLDAVQIFNDINKHFS